jgi:hypothetical protein
VYVAEASGFTKGGVGVDSAAPEAIDASPGREGPAGLVFFGGTYRE